MQHGPAVVLDEDKSIDLKEKLGIKLFFAYLIVYCGFIAINMLKPKLMETKIFLDLNLAVIYGFGLIILAIVMGLIYNKICTGYEDKMNQETETTGKEKSK
ncbi:MAG: DUF485 domain-containing protein [Verrucomicrobiota bacterium]|nr:DUF485 domain-containing protein [Verrucomicrobiota bacterium]